jgi:hypothetical protein
MLHCMLQCEQKIEITANVMTQTGGQMITAPVFMSVSPDNGNKFIHRIGILFEDSAAAHKGHIRME